LLEFFSSQHFLAIFAEDKNSGSTQYQPLSCEVGGSTTDLNQI